MKTLILILSIVSINTYAAEVQRTSNGVVFMVETSTGKHCWGLPQNFDLSKFPTTPMDIEAAAKQYNWPAPTGDQLTACNILITDIWIVQPYKTYPTRPVYSVINNVKTKTKIDVVNKNTLCGGFIQNYSSTVKNLTWRQVTGNTGKQGAAICVRQ